MSRDAIIHELENTLTETLIFFGASSELLRKSYAPGKWTMKEILVHLSDTEAVQLDRLRRLVAESEPLLLVFDQDRWASNLLCAQRDLKIARAQYEAGRQCVLELARLLPEGADACRGMHSVAGPRTFGQALAGIAAQNAHHLEQLRAISQGRPWPDAHD